VVLFSPRHVTAFGNRCCRLCRVADPEYEYFQQPRVVTAQGFEVMFIMQYKPLEYELSDNAENRYPLDR
jgi:hypothetical protein